MTSLKEIKALIRANLRVWEMIQLEGINNINSRDKAKEEEELGLSDLIAKIRKSC